MDLTALATAAAAALAPLLAKGAEKFSEEFGKDAFSKTKTLFERVGRRFKGKPAAEKALADCQTMPSPQSQAALAQALQPELAADADLAQELAALVEELQALTQSLPPGGPKFQVAARVIGVVGDKGTATLNLGGDALKD